jgi:hypothetical protein
MAKYLAIIRDTRHPKRISNIRIARKRIDAINRAIMKTGKAWASLELPDHIKPGCYFTAAFDGMEITIHKESI